MVFKTAATSLLAVFASRTSDNWYLTAALALGSLGDAFLAWPGEAAFLRGLSSFLVAHLFYVALFAGLGNGIDHIWQDQQRLSLAAGMLMLAPVMSLMLMPKVGSALKVPILLYSATILTMVMAVLTVANDRVVVGAILFAISDSVLSTDEFLVPKDSSHRAWMQYLVWILYYSGQFLIAAGLVQ